MSATRIAILGGGPGGLMAAYQLEKLSSVPLSITLFEASDRLGGKLKTSQFQSARIPFEAGAAELYDYSQTGSDPLRELVQEFNLPTRPLSGKTIVIDDVPLKADDDIRRKLGESGYAALKAFTSRARSLITPQEYYESDWKTDNADPLSRQCFTDLLESLKDDGARKYINVAIHSDLATEPNHTNAMYGLQNFLMNEPDYMRLYAIVGGNERLAKELVRRTSARILLNHPVTRVEQTGRGTYRITTRRRNLPAGDEFDFVIAALPINYLSDITWGDASLTHAMEALHRRYDHPAHYLRASLLFKEAFWRSEIAESYFMLDSFGGCCVYDESARIENCAYGVLAWLLAGEGAMTMSNYEDPELIKGILDSLPSCLRHGRELFIEGRVTRWIGAINGLPGGYPQLDPVGRHFPDPLAHPHFVVVGDYLFDATLNGVLDSAITVAKNIIQSIGLPTLSGIGAGSA